MRQQHVEVALVHRHVGRLADRAARVVQPFRHVAQLHEVAEILDRRIAPPALGVAHEGRAVDRREHQVVAADLDAALGVAGVLGDTARRRLAQLAGEAARDVHPLALHVGAGLLPALQRLGIVDEGDADLLQHRLGVGLDDLQRFFVENVEGRNAALDRRGRCDLQLRALGPPRRTAAAASAASPCLFHLTLRSGSGFLVGAAYRIATRPLSSQIRNHMVQRRHSGPLARIRAAPYWLSHDRETS